MCGGLEKRDPPFRPGGDTGEGLQRNLSTRGTQSRPPSWTSLSGRSSVAYSMSTGPTLQAFGSVLIGSDKAVVRYSRSCSTHCGWLGNSNRPLHGLDQVLTAVSVPERIGPVNLGTGTDQRKMAHTIPCSAIFPLSTKEPIPD
jgi:hypothetical protein